MPLQHVYVSSLTLTQYLISAQASEDTQTLARPVNPQPETADGGELKIVISPQLLYHIFEARPIVAVCASSLPCPPADRRRADGVSRLHTGGSLDDESVQRRAVALLTMSLAFMVPPYSACLRRPLRRFCAGTVVVQCSNPALFALGVM
jgi:hypothetical protein